MYVAKGLYISCHWGSYTSCTKLRDYISHVAGATTTCNCDFLYDHIKRYTKRKSEKGYRKQQQSGEKVS